MGPSTSPSATRPTEAADLDADGIRISIGRGGSPDDGAPTTANEFTGLLSDRARAALGQRVLTTLKGETFIALPVGKAGDGTEYRDVAGKELPRVISRDLKFKPEVYSPLRVLENGKIVPKDFNQIMTEISVPITGWVASSRVNFTHVDSDNVLRLKIHKLRSDEEIGYDPKTYVPDPECVAFLTALGAIDPMIPFILADWVVRAADVSKPCPLLTLLGPNGAGKDLIAMAMAAQFVKGGRYAKMGIVVDHFNGHLLKSPITVASEKLPLDERGEQISSEILCELITGDQHSVNEKNRERYDLEGFYRPILTTNNTRWFRAPRGLSKDSADALFLRIVELALPEASQKYLESIGGLEHTGPDWIEGEGKLVKLFRYFIRSHQIPTERAHGRMGLKSHCDRFQRMVAVDNPLAAVIMTGIVAFLTGDPKRKRLIEAIVVEGGSIFVNIGKLFGLWLPLQGIDEAFGKFRGKDRIAPQERLFAEEVSERLAERGDHHPSGGIAGLSYKKIHLDLILDHTRESGGDVTELLGRLNAKEGIAK